MKTTVSPKPKALNPFRFCVGTKLPRDLIFVNDEACKVVGGV